MLQTSDPARKEDGISDETKPVTESIRMLHQTCFGWWKEDKFRKKEKQELYRLQRTYNNIHMC